MTMKISACSGERQVGGTPESSVSTETELEFILQGEGGQRVPGGGGGWKKSALC